MTGKSSKKSTYRLWRMIIIGATTVIIAIFVAILLLHGKNIAVLNPQGMVADQQKALIVFTVILGMVIVIPVFAMLFVVAWCYREGNPKAKYRPNDDENKVIETLWWGVPVVLILILSVVTWITTRQLDPYRSLASEEKPLKIQVVSLQWKWLFLYPDQQIASVNEVRFPENTPVEFFLTADSPMSAFWIPNLGSQTYAMNGMSSKLSLQAHEAGEYRGSNTNISGEGYAGMDFKAISMSRESFDRWVKNLAASNAHLTWNEYEKIAAPSRDTPVSYYMLHESDLYDKIIAKYMGHTKDEHSGGHGGHEGH
jgi:cytochrome o ubiquinol oxidase subunit II